MVIFVRYQPQENGEAEWDSPQDESVGIEEHELECFPTHSEVVVRYAHAHGQPNDEVRQIHSHKIVMNCIVHLNLNIPRLDEERANATNASE